MKHAEIFPCATALVLILIIGICGAWKYSEESSTYNKNAETVLINRANLENTWIISDQHAVRKGKYTQIDATDCFLYLSYSKSSCVDVFNHHGEFQYAILLPDCQNGTVQIRCEDNYLIVSDKNNVVYVFDGREEIDRMNYSQAKLRGYDYFWFDEKKASQKVDDSFYYELDEKGNPVREILLPAKKSGINIFRIALLLIGLLLHCVSVIRYMIVKFHFFHH